MDTRASPRTLRPLPTRRRYLAPAARLRFYFSTTANAAWERSATDTGAFRTQRPPA